MDNEEYLKDQFTGHRELEDREAYTIDNAKLEYSPNLKREERERQAWDRPFIQDDVKIPQNNPKIGEGVVTDLIKRYQIFKEKLASKMDEIKKKYGDTKIEFPDFASSDIEEAMKELGLKGNFNFNNYIEALNKRNTAAGDFLVELSERYFESLEGNIEMELFHDYFELNKEISISEEYLRRQTIGKLYKNINTEEPGWEDLLLKEELSWKARKDNLVLERQDRDRILKESFLFNPEIYNYQKSLKLKEEPAYKEVKAQENQLKDTVHITDNKLVNSEYLFDILEDVQNISKNNNYKETLKSAVNNALENEDLSNNLTQLKQMLTISTEKSNQEKHHYKNSLRNIYNEEFLSHNLDELSVYNELYENTVIPLTSILKFYDEPQDDDTTAFLETITQSMVNSRKTQKNKTRDFDSLNFATYSIRMKKTKETEQKEKERQAYKVLDVISESLKQGGE